MSTTVLNPELIPAQTPPPGMVSNLKDPSSQGYVTITVLVIVMCITTPFVLLRMWTRKFINQKLWWDDCCCVLGWIGLLSLAGLMFRCLAYGGTIDQWNVSEANIKRFNSTFKDVEIVARIGMFFTKVSILLLFQRIFLPPNSPKTKIYWAIWFVFWWNLLYALALVITVLTECVGKEEIEARGGECINTYAVLIGASAINMISDLMIMVIPIAAVWNLHMLPPQKIRLSAVFAIGSLAVFASTARLGYQVSAAKSPNQTVVVMDLSLLNIAEQTIGIIVGCTPVLPVFFRHVSTRQSQSRASNPSHQGLRNILKGNVLVGKDSTPRSSDDPYLLKSRAYEELCDIENQHSRLSNDKGNTTTVQTGGSTHPSVPENALHRLCGNPNTDAVVSCSVHVESYPSDINRGFQAGHSVPAET